MDISPQGPETQSISDDQELAKALAGVMPDAPDAPTTTPATDTPTPADTPAPAADPAAAPTTPSLQFEETPVTPAAVPAPSDLPAPSTPAASSDLDSIKKDALGELRPLIDKVELPAEEKFDTYLMLIRSTDDSSLIGPAHAAAQGITDEKRRAEALLDIIKEIDYLSKAAQPPAN
jgi:hypothetical protein